MKQKDIIVIIVVIFISGVASFFISNLLFSAPDKRNTQVEVVKPISSDFAKPDERYFNSEAIDPTQLIQIGDASGNPQPF